MPAVKDAEDVLEEFAVDALGQPIIPVDPVAIARRLSIEVYTADLEAGVSEMLVKRLNEAAEIYLNRADHQNRQRFTCAHELGHYIKRTNDRDFDFSFVDRRDQMSSTGRDPDEVYANQFAAAMLMPAEEVKRNHRAGQGLAQLAYRFGVSAESMSFRLSNLKLQ